MVNEVGKKPKLSAPSGTISFSDEDLQGVETPHDNALVINTNIANFSVNRVLIDNGSFADIIYCNCFEQMGIVKDRLRPFQGALVGFNGEQVIAEGTIELPVTLEDIRYRKTIMTTFCIVKARSSYNVILGRPFLNSARAIPSSWHVCLKFLSPKGVGTIQGNQKVARQCDVGCMKSKNSEVLTTDDPQDPRPRKQKDV
ncbi:Beta-porphyranase [Quillaja saponaria]|uniref:Beta-porphyranase n=1 Tax=Quillaja saponaria TaxID=32244 RepID=A0AAD7Q473_QUISA|nr:Beta-porphyranase [Quillaja saponaria]